MEGSTRTSNSVKIFCSYPRSLWLTKGAVIKMAVLHSHDWSYRTNHCSFARLLSRVLHSSVFWTKEAQGSRVKGEVSTDDHELKEPSVALQTDLWENASSKCDAWILIIFTKTSLSVLLSCSEHRKQGKYHILLLINCLIIKQSVLGMRLVHLSLIWIHQPCLNYVFCF